MGRPVSPQPPRVFRISYYWTTFHNFPPPSRSLEQAIMITITITILITITITILIMITITIMNVCLGGYQCFLCQQIRWLFYKTGFLKWEFFVNSYLYLFIYDRIISVQHQMAVQRLCWPVLSLLRSTTCRTKLLKFLEWRWQLTSVAPSTKTAV